MKKTMRRTFLVLAVAALAACAAPSLDPQARAAIRTVHVEPPRLPQPTVVPPEGGAAALAAGSPVPAGREAVARLQQIVEQQVQLSSFITATAQRELQARGYRIAPTPAGADATVRFTVFHGLGASAVTSGARGVAMTVNTEVVRNADGKRLLFQVANQVDAETRARTRHERYAAWFENEAMTIEQYRLVAAHLVAQSLRGL